eukprot:TRINITY_DN9391_c0_g1_i1.p1 TRINITY_DN9391_c0_g1~~TRINITY_DN9391_c0_g1_i1.p1  ORF type:complete len:129 (-),score=13.59 TRINITY_DN9391_c0_g1_i1:156-542(-)
MEARKLARRYDMLYFEISSWQEVKGILTHISECIYYKTVSLDIRADLLLFRREGLISMISYLFPNVPTDIAKLIVTFVDLQKDCNYICNPSLKQDIGINGNFSHSQALLHRTRFCSVGSKIGNVTKKR